MFSPRDLENGTVLRISSNYVKSSSGKMRMTHKIGIYWTLESAQSPRVLVKNADSATPHQCC